VNLSYEAVMSRLARLLVGREGESAVLVVGSAGQRREIERQLATTREPVDVVAVDVDAAADVDAFCDAHDLPFPDESFDAVIVTAVLEHVIDPVRVVAEMHRVLRPDGFVYTELPFMQQVHEGAYDFTRFSLTGHRRLMRHFDELDSGAVAGPGTALVWSLEHFLVAVMPQRAALVVRAVTRLLFGWVKHVDRFVATRPAALDAASCTYFFGRRRDGDPISDAEVVSGYRGAQRVSHV
jgi:SAM-dependent methyltransferase